MSEKIRLSPDFCVIGAGAGGLSFAAGAAQLGARVVLLESQRMGGDCLNAGCVPSKALIAAAQAGHHIRKSAEFGWSVSSVTLDFTRVHAHVHDVIKTLSHHDSVERFEKLGVQVIAEEGAFLDDTTVETDTYLIKAKRFVLATGSVPFVPPIDGLSDVAFLTNESIFDLTVLPDHLVVIGGGPIGIELAQAFVRLGSQVTVLEAFDALPKDDPEITSTLKRLLIAEGMDLNENVTLRSVCNTESGIQIIYTTSDGHEKHLIASHVLVATGRRPNIQRLRLDAAKIRFTPRGIEVDRHLRTSNRRVYAIGDCTGGYQFTHVAAYHAGLAIRHSMFKLRTKVQTRAIPWVTYTDPELAHVGYLESQLIQEKKRYRVVSMDVDQNDRAQAEKCTQGVIKVLVSPGGVILGVTILGKHAGELIYPWVIAIENKLTLSAITRSIAPYPTLSDLTKRVSGQFYAEKLFSPAIKRFVKLMMRLTR